MENLVLQNCKICNDHHTRADKTDDVEQKIGLLRLRDEAANKTLQYIKAFLEEEIRQNENVKGGQAYLMELRKHCNSMIQGCIDCNFDSAFISKNWSDSWMVAIARGHEESNYSALKDY
jgi:hypothetical protein